MSRRFASRSDYEAWKSGRGQPAVALPDPAPPGSLVPESDPDAPRREFRVEVIVEGALGTLLLGASKLPIEKMEAVLNRYGSAGWDLAFMLIEKKRFFLFWRREAAIITFVRPVPRA